ncbi:MAG: beta-propeller fold lactonase family protein [Streptosporangiaceae bacterium]
MFGQLTSIGSSPYADGQTAPCWVEISRDGRYLFTVNTGSGTISSYSIKPDGSLVLIGSFAIKGGGADIDAHLVGCPHCTEYLAQMRETIRVTGRLTPEDLAPQVRDELVEVYRRWQSEQN